jgi:hypothetical protein
MISEQATSIKSVRTIRARAMQGLCLTLGLFLVCIPLFSQGNQGRITGTITDQTGGVVSGATVTVLDVDRGTSRTLTTTDAGEYNAPNLLPGTYSVRAEAKGFKAVERQKILIEVGKELRVDLSLQPGEIAQTITITESLPLVETANATLGGTLSNQTINDLPLNGRNYINLLTLRPGMQVYPGGGSAARSANGLRPEDIGYLLDGVREDDPYTGSSITNAVIPAGDASTSLPIDAIQEFNTEQDPKAEFGWKPGAIVNAGVKSGSNTIHGTAFAFGRETAFDARNFFNYANQSACATTPAICNKAPVALEQYGASLGGPLKKDKLFYFINYEGQHYTVGSTLTFSSPMTVGATGVPDPVNSLVDACTAVGIANVAALSAQIAGLNADCSVKPTNFKPGASESLFPTNTGTGQLPLGLVSTNSQKNGVAKLDYHINDSHSLSGMYFNGQGGGIWNDGAYQVGLPGATSSPWMSNLYGYVQVGSGAWTWTPSSTVVNQLRVGYAHFHQFYDSVDSNVNPLAYGINTGVTDPRFFGFPFIRITPFNFRLGGNWPKHPGPTGSLDTLESVSILRGKHTFKFGGEIVENTADVFVTANGKGSIRFNSSKAAGGNPARTALENFLLGAPRSTGTLSALLVGDPERHLSNQGYAAFMQDDWHVLPRVTVNLGLRYEVQTVLKDRDNKLGNFDPTLGLVQVGKGETSAFHGDHNNFSPRVGFAWDVRGNGKTVVRGGGSIMYEQLPYSVFIAVGNALGLNQVPTGASLVVNGVTTPGAGNMGVLSVNIPGNGGLTTGWQAQTAACVSGGTTACGSVFPAALFTLQCGDGSTPAGQSFPALPCNTEAVDPNLRLPYVSTWSLGIQRAITNDLSIDISYVGNHGTKFLGFADINEPPLGSGNTNLATCVVPAFLTVNATNCEQVARPYYSKFPYLAQIDRLSNIDKSNYNGLHMTLTQRPSHGLSFLVGYTYSHALDNASANFGSNFLPIDSTHPAGMYGNSDFDVRHRLTLTTTYALPGKKSPGQLLEGWQLNSVVTVQTGAPWTAQDLSNDFSGTGQVSELDSFGQFWNISGPPSAFNAGPTAIPFFTPDPKTGPNPANPTLASSNPDCLAHASAADLGTYGCYERGGTVLVPPAAGTIGNAGRGIFRGPSFKNWDVSVVKDEKFKERLTAQFRAEFFNVLNHPNFYNPTGPAGAGFNDPSGSSFGCGCNTPDQASPNPVLGTGASRSIQLGLKLIW